MQRRLYASKDKAKVRAWAIKEGRKVLWKDADGKWHAATDQRNTPTAMAIEVEAV